MSGWETGARGTFSIAKLDFAFVRMLSLRMSITGLAAVLLAATSDADPNDVHGRGGSQRGASHRGQNPNQGATGSSDMSFGGIKWQSNNVVLTWQVAMQTHGM